MFRHRPVSYRDIQLICSFPQSESELFYFYPKAVFPLTPEQLQIVIDQRKDSTVVEQGGNVVGFADFYRWKGGVCSIGNVIVAPSARGRGVAKYLVETMIFLAGSNHTAAIVEVSCFSQNIAGLLLYRKLGFKPFDIEARKTPDGSRTALIHMRYDMAFENAPSYG